MYGLYFTFLAHAFKHVPGAILSLAVASHSTCTNEEAVGAPPAVVPEVMTEEDAAAATERITTEQTQLAGVIEEAGFRLSGL